MRFNLFQKSIFILLAFVILQGCTSQESNSKPPELIEFRTIESGLTDYVYVDELFFKEN